MNTENRMLCSKSAPTDEVRMHTQVDWLAAGRSVHSRTSQLRIVQTRRHAYQLDYYWSKQNLVSAVAYTWNILLRPYSLTCIARVMNCGLMVFWALTVDFKAAAAWKAHPTSHPLSQSLNRGSSKLASLENTLVWIWDLSKQLNVASF